MTTSATKTSSRRNSGKRKRSRHWQPPGNARNTLATCCCRWMLCSIPRRGTTPTRKQAARLRMAWSCCMRQACLWIAGWTQTMRWVALHCETSPTTRPSFPVSVLTRRPACLATPAANQVLSQVSGACAPGVARAPSSRTCGLQVHDARVEGGARARDSTNPARGAGVPASQTHEGLAGPATHRPALACRS